MIHRKKNNLLYKEDTRPSACGSVILVAGFLSHPAAGVLAYFLGFPPHSFFFFVFVVVLSSIATPGVWLSVFFCDILYPVRSVSVPSNTFKDRFFFLVLLLWLSRVTSATFSCLAVLIVSRPLFFHAPPS